MQGRQTNYINETISGINTQNAILKNQEFEECRFEKCFYLQTTFENCHFTDCTFINCSISTIKPVNSSFMNIKFKDSKVMGFDWTKARTVQLLEFENCDISYSNFSQLKLPHLKLISCTAKEVDFGGTYLKESIFTNTNFEQSKFLSTNLEKADFRKAYNYGIDITANNLKKAKFSLPEAAALLKSFDISIE